MRIDGKRPPADDDVGDGAEARDEVDDVGAKALGIAGIIGEGHRQRRAQDEFARVIEDRERTGAGAAGQDQGGDEARCPGWVRGAQ